jgi:hypothetical protein
LLALPALLKDRTLTVVQEISENLQSIENMIANNLLAQETTVLPQKMVN